MKIIVGHSNMDLERVAIVDTRTPATVKEYLDLVSGNGYETEIFDHHPTDLLSYTHTETRKRINFMKEIGLAGA